MMLMGVFAVLALILATIGVFGGISFFVNRRVHDIGIRMALGAKKSDVLGMILCRGLGLAGVGIGLGIAGALVLSRSLASLLEGVQTHDLASFSAPAAAFALIATTACWIPARRAANADPTAALRHE